MASGRVGDAVVGVLQAASVRTVFGIPGIHTLGLYDALAGTPSIRHILTRHEQGAAFAADGYARVLGVPGVCSTTTGPGTFNTLAAVAEAWSDSSPVVVLAGQIDAALDGLGHGVLHETPDQGRSFEALTAFTGRPRTHGSHPGRGRRGAALLDDRTAAAGLRRAPDRPAAPAVRRGCPRRRVPRTGRAGSGRGRRRGPGPVGGLAGRDHARRRRPPRARLGRAAPARDPPRCAGHHADHRRRRRSRPTTRCGPVSSTPGARNAAPCSRRRTSCSSSAAGSTTSRPRAGRSRSGRSSRSTSIRPRSGGRTRWRPGSSAMPGSRSRACSPSSATGRATADVRLTVPRERGRPARRR